MSKKGHRRSEIKKYLDTLLADMGLEEIGTLSPEEQRAWEAAAAPRKDVEKRLKEMGYDLRGNRNKRSLGRKKKLIDLFKMANMTDLEEEKVKLRYLVGASAYSVVLPLITEFSNSYKTYPEDEYYRVIISQLNNTNEDFSGKESEIERVVANIAGHIYNSKEKKSTPSSSRERTTTRGSISLDDYFKSNSKPISSALLSQKSRIYLLAFLGKLGYVNSWNASDDEIESALLAFQKLNNLDATGLLDAKTFEKLFYGYKTAVPATQTTPSQRSTRQSPGEANEFDHKVDHIILGRNVKLNEVEPELQKIIYRMDNIVKKLGLNNLYITSAFRSDYDQSRIMYSNYSERGVGSSAARSYLEKLYGKLPNISKIVDAYEGLGTKEEKIKRGEGIIARTWPQFGHRTGRAIDIAGLSKSELDLILKEVEKHHTFKNKLWEGDHYHLAI